VKAVGKASEWLREERRKTLGDWVAFCLACGHAQRYFEENEASLPSACPACGGGLRHRCPACGARFSSVFAVECEACGAALRPAEHLGVPIRKQPR
jgi:predicted nucleic acid-binding Zn ribbon protein